MLKLLFQGIPPTSNHAYTFLRKQGKKVLSTEGKKYLAETKTEAGKQAVLYPGVSTAKGYNLVYRVEVPWEELFTKGWPKTAKNRYQGWDVSNRCKLFEDAIKAAIGIDDSNFDRVAGYKCVGDEPVTRAWIWSGADEWVDFNELLDNPKPVNM
jgi:hypothetical protein